MSDCFEKEKHYVFDIETYKANGGISEAWPPVCNGKPVSVSSDYAGWIDGYLVAASWCKEVGK